MTHIRTIKRPGFLWIRERILADFGFHRSKGNNGWLVLLERCSRSGGLLTTSRARRFNPYFLYSSRNENQPKYVLKHQRKDLCPSTEKAVVENLNLLHSRQKKLLQVQKLRPTEDLFSTKIFHRRLLQIPHLVLVPKLKLETTQLFKKKDDMFFGVHAVRLLQKKKPLLRI